MPVSITERQFAELMGRAPEGNPEALRTVGQKQFLVLVDFLGADAPIWAVEMAFDLDGAKK